MIYALIGIGLAVALPCTGSAIGVQMGGRAAAGVVSEKPELFTKAFLLQVLPGTQGIYGFLVGFLVLIFSGILNGTANLTNAEGLKYLAACLPIAIAGFTSAIYQGRTAASAIHMVAKQPDSFGRGMTMTILVETYAILSLLASILVLIKI